MGSGPAIVRARAPGQRDVRMMWMYYVHVQVRRSKYAVCQMHR